MERRADAVRVFENRDLVVKQVRLERIADADAAKVLPLRRVLSIGRHQLIAPGAVLGIEDTSPAEACDADGQRSAHPVCDVEVMAAFFEQMRSRIYRLAAPVAEDAPAHREFERLIELKRDELAELALVQHLPDA